jgi:hypothetical protein
MKTTGNKGDWAELIFLTELMRLGIETAIPYGNRAGYDLLARSEKDGQWKRIQIKTAYPRKTRSKNMYVDFLRGSGSVMRRQYTKDDFDYLVAVYTETGEFWSFPVSAVEGRRCRTVDTLMDEYQDVDWL